MFNGSAYLAPTLPDFSDEPICPISVVFIGGERVGKSCLIKKFIEDRSCHYSTLSGLSVADTYSDEYSRTQALVSDEKYIFVGKDIVNFTLYDFPGNKNSLIEHIDLVHMFSVIVLVIDLTNLASPEEIRRWKIAFDQVQEKKQQEYGRTNVNRPLLVLVGTKSDDLANRKISSENFQQLSQELSCQGYFEISAKTGTNVKALFDYIAAKKVPAQKAIMRQLRASERRRKPPRFGVIGMTVERFWLRMKTRWNTAKEKLTKRSLWSILGIGVAVMAISVVTILLSIVALPVLASVLVPVCSVAAVAGTLAFASAAYSLTPPSGKKDDAQRMPVIPSVSGSTSPKPEVSPGLSSTAVGVQALRRQSPPPSGLSGHDEHSPPALPANSPPSPGISLTSVESPKCHV
ncbi:MAG: hypothetical protein A2X77_03725 [Gammaproteobacteria bacterium GWE2_42_36]|nr:MAG: hypothetical protein A2X77_03725 [Gammaproteobacteria bacterium GWE2_42_36]HCU04811.1 hypothetical protein [Coxiellaceae bacterium]